LFITFYSTRSSYRRFEEIGVRRARQHFVKTQNTINFRGYSVHITSTRVAQKVMPHIFFSEIIYSECTKFTHSITGDFLYTCFFPPQFPSTSTVLLQRETRTCTLSLYQLVSCSSTHVLIARITFLHFLKP
jgi:hypothetical protein